MPTGAAVPETDVDIVGGDLGANHDRVVAVVRTLSASAMSPTERAWAVRFTTSGRTFELWALSTRDGTRGMVVTGDEVAGAADVTIDEAHRLVRIETSARVLRWYGRFDAGTTLSGISATAYRGDLADDARGPGLPLMLHGNGVWAPRDDAATERTYVVGTRTCAGP